jgi:flagellar basal body P-ring formation protein FlgA
MKALFPRRSLLIGLALSLSIFTSPALAQEIVVVPVRVIYPGETVSSDALDEMLLRRPPRGMSAIARAPADLEGKVARRTLLPGRLVPLASVREPHMVEQGSAVTAVFADGALTISIVAVPLQSGAVGDLIKLRNLDSGAVFTGIVMQDGTVRVGAS